MTVRPTPSGQNPRPAISRTERPLTPAPASGSRTPDQANSASPAPQRDDVQISAQARGLQQADTTRAVGGELSADRLHQVLGRMTDGHYDSPEVQDQVVRRVARDL